MSYEKVKAIRANRKENRITITSADNNLRPLYFDKRDMDLEPSASFEDKLAVLFFESISGELHFGLGGNCLDYAYATMRTKSLINDSGTDSHNLWRECRREYSLLVDKDHKNVYSSMAAAVRKVYGSYFDKWKEFVKDENPLVELLYNGCSVTRLGYRDGNISKFHYYTLRCSNKTMKFKLAWIAKYIFEGDNLEIAKAE